MVTKEPKIKELALADVDKCLRKALKMKDPRNKFECLKSCIALNAMLLGFELPIVVM